MSPSFSHIPVLKSEVLDVLKPSDGETILDCTLGLGGHALAFLEAVGSSGKVVGLDADEKNLARAKEVLSDYSGQTEFHHCNFSDLEDLDLLQVDILFADLGLSSPHIDDPSRGFSFREDGPLDLRYDQSQAKPALQLIRSINEEDITHVLKVYGELRESKKLARAIKDSHPETTQELRSIVENVCGYRAPKLLPQVFQALRIATNDELGSLKKLLEIGPNLLKPGGRMGIISYHSLEDRLVKHAFKDLITVPKHPDTGQDKEPASFELITKKPITPSDDEINENQRSRSALLRVIRKIQ